MTRLRLDRLFAGLLASLLLFATLAAAPAGR